MGVLLKPGDIRGESFYNDKLPGVIEQLKQDGVLQNSQGAGVVFVEGFQDKDGNPLPMIVQRRSRRWIGMISLQRYSSVKRVISTCNARRPFSASAIAPQTV